MTAPTIGRIVWYQAHGSPNGLHPSVARPAMITQVHDEKTVDLTVFNPTGLFFNQRCELDDGSFPGGGAAPGRWRWPEMR